MSVPYLGSRIVLISKSEIRYEGTLYTIDTAQSTVALQNVRSFGTENRKDDGFIAPSAEVFDYIIFRGQDIKDLHVCETPTEPTPPTAQVPSASVAAAPPAAPVAPAQPTPAPPSWGANPNAAKAAQAPKPAAGGNNNNRAAPPAANAAGAAQVPKPATGVVRGGRSQPGTGGHVNTRATGPARAPPSDQSFDFETMLMGFNKMDVANEASSKIKTSTAYNKGSSFFDSLDEEIDGQKKGKGTAFGHGADTHSRAQALALYGSLAKRLGPYAASDVAFVRARLPEDKVWRGLGYDSLS